MADEDNFVSGMTSQEEELSKSSKERTKRRKNKKKRQSLGGMNVEEDELNGNNTLDESKGVLQMEKEGKEKRKKSTKKLLQNPSRGEDEEEEFKIDVSEDVNPRAEQKEKEEEKRPLKQGSKSEEEQMSDGISLVEAVNPDSNHERNNGLKNMKRNKKHKLLKEATKADRRGICYLSRIPPHMDHVNLRQILSQYGEIQRIYLVPEDPTAQVLHKKPGRTQRQGFSEGWVEFANKIVAKRVANLLNGEQIGGRKRSHFYFDLWNIKYLSKFKWDDLTEEIAYKNAIHKQKLALEFSAAKRERDSYLDKVDKSRALSSIEERIKKKQKVQQESGVPVSVSEVAPKVIRQFRQTRPVADKAEQSKPKLSQDILAGVFGSS